MEKATISTKVNFPDVVKRVFVLFFFAAIPPLIIAYLSELIQRKTLFRTFIWISSNLNAFGLEYILVFFVFIILSLVINRYDVAFLVTSLIFTTLATINYYKLNIRGEPFYPWDILSQGEFFNVVGKANIKLELRIIVIFITLILSFPLLKRVTINRPIKRIVFLIVMIILSLGCINYVYLNNVTLSKMDITRSFYDQKTNYNANGFILAFTNNFYNIITQKPEGYSHDKVRNILDRKEDVIQRKAENIKPNIIMVMNEAFWNPTLLPGVSFSEDPLPTVHKLEKEGNVGNIIIPQFGGGTANVEFEVLTGYTMDFLPTDALAYQQYIKNDFNSIVEVLNTQGYNSIALHPYDRTFWNRDKVYSYFNFKQFITKEDFTDKDYKGNYVSDNSTYKKIIDIYEKNLNSNKPLFNFTITMQNHYNYYKEKYSSEYNNLIRVYSQELSEQEKEVVQSYAIGVKDADSMLKSLINYFSKVKDPTIVVFFGDHLPSLDGYDIYKNTNFIEEGTQEEYTKKLYKTPLIIWNNFDKDIKVPKYLTSYYLSPYILREFGLKEPSFFDFLNDLRTSIPAYRRGEVVTDNQNALPPEQEELWDKYRMLQYDYLFGKQYGKEKMYRLN